MQCSGHAHLSCTNRCTPTASAAASGPSASSSWAGRAPPRRQLSLPNTHNERKPRPEPHHVAWPDGKLLRPRVRSAWLLPGVHSGVPLGWLLNAGLPPLPQQRSLKSGRGRPICGQGGSRTVACAGQQLHSDRLPGETCPGSTRKPAIPCLGPTCISQKIGCQAGGGNDRQQAQAHVLQLSPVDAAHCMRGHMASSGRPAVSRSSEQSGTASPSVGWLYWYTCRRRFGSGGQRGG